MGEKRVTSWALIGSAGAVPCTLVLMTGILCGCASTKIDKTYSKTGKLTEIRVISKDRVKEKILLEYDTAARLISLSKQLPPSDNFTLRKRFYYDTQGKLRIQSHTEENTPGSQGTKDAWVESFFYDVTGRLYRTETSHKSSYTIARYKTPLLVTRYHYGNGRITKVIIEAGVFKKELLFRYKGAKLNKIDFVLMVPDKDRRRFTQKRSIVLTMDGITPEGAVDKSAGAVSLKKDEYIKFFHDENIAVIIQRPSYARDQKVLIDHLVDTVVHE